MAELKIEGSHEEQWGMIKSAVIQHHSAINGNGQPGLMDFMSGLKAQLRLIIVLISVGGLVLAFLTFLVLNREIKTGLIRVENGSIMAETQSTDWRH